MKKFEAVLSICGVVFVMSCSSQTDLTPTDIEKDVIIKEIKPVLAQIIEGSESGNIDKAIEPYLNTQEFIAIGNGRVYDFSGFKDGNKQYFEALESQQFAEKETKYTVLDKRTVIATWSGTGLAILKDSQKLNIDPYVATLVFKKMNEGWKVIYTHESNVITLVVAQPEK